MIVSYLRKTQFDLILQVGWMLCVSIKSMHFYLPVCLQLCSCNSRFWFVCGPMNIMTFEFNASSGFLFCAGLWRVESKNLCACVRVGALALNSWPRHSGLQFSPSSRFSIVNEEDRRERGLLVLIYPGGSLGITINSQLRAHSTGLHRHCQFVPIREPSFWVSAVRGCSGPTGEQPVRPWLRT